MDDFEKRKDNSSSVMLTGRSIRDFQYSFQNLHTPSTYVFPVDDRPNPSHHSTPCNEPDPSMHSNLYKINQRQVPHGHTSVLQSASRSEVLPCHSYPHLIPCNFATSDLNLKTCLPSNASEQTFTQIPNKQPSSLETTTSNIHMIEGSREHYQENRIHNNNQICGNNFYNQRIVRSNKQSSQEYKENHQQMTIPELRDKMHTLETLGKGANSFETRSASNVNHTDEINTGINDIFSKLTSGKAYYKCGFCELKLSSNEALLGHINTHTESMPYSCSLCSVSFVEGRQLMRHVQHCHNVKPPYACGLCDQNFHENLELEQHVLSHNQDKSIADSDLEVASFVDRADSGHSTLVNVKSDHKEEYTREETESEEEDQNNENCFPSETVSKQSNTILITKDTRLDVHKEPSKILMNDVDFESACTVIVEPSSAGGIRKKHLFKCNFCEKICKDRGSLVSHVRTHTKCRPYECHKCKATFKQYAHLSDHMMTKHSKDRPYVCDRCAKSFSRKSHLQDHIRLKHTEDKLYHCTECPLTFEKRADFTEHKRSHGKKLKHQCTLCPRQFRSVTDYERHLRSHTKEKPFECEICHLKFGLLANAKKHMVKHSTEKPFKCDICPKAYHFAHEFKRHRVTHLKKKPFPCSECYKSFKNSALLQKHKNTVHRKTQLELGQLSKTKREAKSICTSVSKLGQVNYSEPEIKKSHAKGKDCNLRTNFIAGKQGNEEIDKSETKISIPQKQRGRPPKSQKLKAII